MEIPRLDEGRFEELTISGQLRVIQRAVGEGPAILMGSSLGGYLAALYAARHPKQMERLVLLAPAFQFPRRWRERYSPEDWKREGSMPVFHYGEAGNGGWDISLRKTPPNTRTSPSSPSRL